jgi:hypothetical protein
MNVNLENVGKLLAVISQIKTPSFVSVLNYKNDQGEVSNYTINLGASYGNAKEADTEWLKNQTNIVDVDFGDYKAFAKEAWAEMLEARTNPKQATVNRSEGQTEAYITVCPNIRVHKETGRIFIYGFVVSKTVLVKGTYKSVNSSGKTLAKKKIGKHLKTENFRQVAFDKLETVKAKGQEIEITVG